MIKFSLKFWLSCFLLLIPSLNTTNPRFSLQATTVKKIRLPEVDLPSPHLYSYEGQRGRRGRSGRDGRDGRNGADKEITIDGSPINLDLSGVAGRDGEYGREGADARCSSIDINGRSEIELADGGRGGDGGKGGDGGDGGSLTVVYSQLEHLKQVNVRSPGGDGGLGGDGGDGGIGCTCPFNVFDSSSNGSNNRIRCRSGRDGSLGRAGRDGSDGQPGTLYLVKQGEQLRSEHPTTVVSMSSLAQGTPIDLSNNIWKSYSGASQLLHPDSVIADTYNEYIKRLEKKVVPQWKESRPASDFDEQEIGLELTEQDELAVTYPQEVWLDVEISDTQQNTLLTVNNAITEAETTDLARGSISGNEESLVFTLIDQARKSDTLNTQFEIKLKTSNNRFDDSDDSVRYKTRYEGIVPAAAVKRDGQRFNVALGQLPIDSKYLRSGTLVEVRLTAIRSLGGNSAEQKISWSGRIGD